MKYNEKGHCKIEIYRIYKKAESKRTKKDKPVLLRFLNQGLSVREGKANGKLDLVI